MTKNNKDKIDLDKRKFKTADISSVAASLVKSIGGRLSTKNTALMIKLVNHWADIMGQDFADKSTPLKIISKRQKNKETGEQEQIMVLKLQTQSALGTVIGMREAIILERLNRLFGTDQFKKLSIEHGYAPTPKQNLPKNEKIVYDLDLPDIDDPVLKSRLESLGQAVMNSAQNKKT